MTDKIELRKKAKNIRRHLDMENISAQLTDFIRQNKIYINAKNIMLFYPTEYEIDLRELLSDNKNFYLPKVEGENLLVCPYCKELKKSDLGIYEPCSEPINPEILDVVIVPALMVDKNNNRLGYGKGFYDKFLSKYGQNFKTICPIPKELLTQSLPISEFDQKIDEIITTT